MFDESYLNQTHLFSASVAYFSTLLLIGLIFYSYYLLLNLPSMSARQHTVHLTLIMLGLIYIFLLENYQFYYIMTMFYENF